jgi:hypothetical protein
MEIVSLAPLNEKNLPALYQATDTAAKRHQRWFILSLVAEIVFALLGALALVLEQNAFFADTVGSIGSIQMGGSTVATLSLATAVALIATAITLLVRYIFKPGEKWRESRYLGERCATLAWRYTARATPADLDRGQDAGVDANQWYLKQINELFTQARQLNLPEVDRLDQLTPAMSALRNAPVEQRYTIYLQGRAINQRDWYNKRARMFLARRNTLRFLTIVVYVVGAGLVLAHATALRDQAPFGLLAANYWPLVAATAGAITGYVAARHYDDLQQSYRYMRDCLSAEINVMSGFTLTATTGERAVSDWVDHIETLLDAEHQQWHALG